MRAENLNQEKLLAIQDWLDDRFTGKNKPSIRTVQNWCNKGQVPAKQIGSLWFIKVKQELIETGNPLVDNVLKSTAGLQ